MPTFTGKEASLFDPGSRFADARAARVLLLAFSAAFLLTLPLRAAQAQTLPTDPCLKDPASCLPNVDVDPCLADPASCLPNVDVDPCLADPASCLPDPEDVDPCLANPGSCVPDPEDVDRCVADPASCVPREREVEKCVDSPEECLSPPDRGNEDSPDEPGAAPGGGANNRPAGGDGPRGDAGGGTAEARAGSAPTTAAADPVEAPTALASANEAPSLLDRVGRGLLDAAQRFSFPLLLGASVAAFLLIQGHIDRKDPKLAVAPVDTRDDVVLFQ